MKVFLYDLYLSTANLASLVSQRGMGSQVAVPYPAGPGFAYVARIVSVDAEATPVVDIELVRISRLADREFAQVSGLSILSTALREQPVLEKSAEENLWQA